MARILGIGPADRGRRINRRRCAVGIDDHGDEGVAMEPSSAILSGARIMALLPDRRGDTVAAWLLDHPGIDFVARDGGASYGEAASKGVPEAIQIADR
jgi:hypothetical protein